MSNIQTIIPWVPDDTLCHGVLGSVPQCYSVHIGQLWPFFWTFYLFIKGLHEKSHNLSWKFHRWHEEFNSGAKAL
jgi:hypothetical protein